MRTRKDNLNELRESALYCFLETKEWKNTEDEIKVIESTSLKEIREMKKIYSILMINILSL